MKTILPSPARNHAALSHPEAEERASAFRPIDASLRDQLAAYIERNSLTRAEAGRELGFPDGTAVSKYLNDRYDRDPAGIEAAIRDILSTEGRRRAFVGEIYKTNVVDKLALFIDRVRQTEKVGVFTGEAGIGKTVAIAAYIKANPTALIITANAIQNDAKGMKQLLWNALSATPRNDRSHYEQLVEKLRGSRRPLIVDNAQRLGAGGRSFIFDFHDATGLPVILVGNPVILKQVARVDQEHSRTARDVRAELKDPKRIVRALISQHLDDPDEILDLALQVVTKPYGGHLRALSHLLAEMSVLMELPSNAHDPRGSFLKALAASVDHKGLAA